MRGRWWYGECAQRFGKYSKRPPVGALWESLPIAAIPRRPLPRRHAIVCMQSDLCQGGASLIAFIVSTVPGERQRHAGAHHRGSKILAVRLAQANRAAVAVLGRMQKLWFLRTFHLGRRKNAKRMNAMNATLSTTPIAAPYNAMVVRSTELTCGSSALFDHLVAACERWKHRNLPMASPELGSMLASTSLRCRRVRNMSTKRSNDRLLGTARAGGPAQ